jgi:PHD/YefM family antitoxin component YafN of YafNO toxin-antitoxin module
MITVQTHEARKQLAKLIELVFYKNERVQIMRSKRPMAWLVGEPYMQAVERLVEAIETRDPQMARELTAELEALMQEGVVEVE